MTLTSSSGTWLNGALQPQHHYVSLEISDPEGRALTRVELTFEQASRMLLYNGEVECTLARYRNTDGELVAETVTPPESVHSRMKARLGKVQESILNRVKDARRDVYEMINGDKKPGKNVLAKLLSDIDVINNHLSSNQDFVVSQAEEELGEMQSNAIGQLGIFIQSKTGLQAPEEALKNLLPTGTPTNLLGKPVKPVVDNYTLKARSQKPITEMTAMEIADVIRQRIKFFENSLSDKSETSLLYGASVRHVQNKVEICYVSYQGKHTLELEVARRYLKFLIMIEPNQFKRHWDITGTF
jgi:hypothetical protein